MNDLKLAFGISGHNFTDIEPVMKGWSDDKKYFVTDRDGTKYLLRISDAEKYDSKKAEFELMRKFSALDIPMCQPVEFGVCDAGIYSLQSYIDGRDAEELIPSLSASEQYRYGFEAGVILKKLHSIPAPPDSEDWESRFNRKIDRKIKGYLECPIHYDNGGAFLDYISENRGLLHGRPQCYQHGDYHIGNMMIDRNGRLVIIDFNRSDCGDPWEEFNRIVWCAQCSHEFASGMADGYFDGDIPYDFWRLLALYISSNTLSSIYWAIPFGQAEIDTMINQAADVLDWYDGMKDPVPKWYKK